MDRAGILKFIAACGLPEGVKACLASTSAAKEGSALKKALRKDPAGLLAGIEGLLRGAAAILGVPEETSLFVTGFNANNRAPDRFEAALAELRAAVFLGGQGFTGLKQVEQTGSRSADLSGKRGGLVYVFEVCRLRDTGEPAGTERLRAKYAKKIRQVKVSRKKYGCALGGLVLLDGPLGFGPLVPDPALLSLAAEVSPVKDRAGSEYLCLLRGNGYAVWPDWRA
jgi:hypothetical protein